MIRLATAPEADGVRDLVHAAYRHYVPRIGKPPGPMLDDYVRRVAGGQVWLLEEAPGARQIAKEQVVRTRESALQNKEPEHFHFSGQAGNALAGILVLEDGPDGLMIDNIAVDPARRGTGCGKALMVFAEAEARRRGYSRLRLYTHALMSENLALYRRVGFHESGRVTEKGFDRIYMVKDLT